MERVCSKLQQSLMKMAYDVMEMDKFFTHDCSKHTKRWIDAKICFRQSSIKYPFINLEVFQSWRYHAAVLTPPAHWPTCPKTCLSSIWQLTSYGQAATQVQKHVKGCRLCHVVQCNCYDVSTVKCKSCFVKCALLNDKYTPLNTA